MKNFYETNLKEYGIGITYAWPVKASAANCKDVVANVSIGRRIGYGSENKSVKDDFSILVCSRYRK